MKEIIIPLGTIQKVLVKATKDGMADSDIGEYEYTVLESKVATPEANYPAGRYPATKEVSLSCATDGATIYYTTDGSDPTNEDTEYTEPFDVTEDTTVKAIAVKTDYTDSNVMSVEYRIFLAVTQAYITRVEADGGYVVDMYDLDDDVRFLSGEAVNGYTLSASVLSSIGFYGGNRCGLKVASGLVTNLYDVAHNADATYDYTQSDANRRPALTNGDIVYDGSDNCLIGGAGAITVTKQKGEINVFGVHRLPTIPTHDPAAFNYIWLGTVDDSGKARSTLFLNTSNQYGCGGRGGDDLTAGYATGTTAQTSQSALKLASGQIKYSNRTAKIAVNGATDGTGSSLWSAGTTATENTNSSGVAIGGSYYAGGYNDTLVFKGIIDAVLIIPAALSDADFGEINAYLMNKYGIE
jgi:hypothetical protein